MNAIYEATLTLVRVAREGAALLELSKPGYPLPPASRAIAATLAFAIGSTAHAAISLTGPGQVPLPSVNITGQPSTQYSTPQILELKNPNVKDGWILTGEVLNGTLQGSQSGETIDAELVFLSITWTGGGNGSAAGLTIYPDGKTIEADPGFGRGTYSIEFEVRFEVPAFPRADDYFGVSSFSVQ